MIKIDICLGTRPELIKLAPLIKLLQAQEDFSCHVTATGQHGMELIPLLNWFDIKIDTMLNTNLTVDRTITDLLSSIVKEYGDLVIRNTPDIVIVQGDTTSALAASLVTFYNNVTIFHVEAGLRSHNLYSPFPEEANRKLISVIADKHFAPTELSRQNLIIEGIESKKIFVTGNTVVDSLNFTLNKLGITSQGKSGRSQDYCLITVHRRESWGEGLKNILEAIKASAKLKKDFDFKFILHPNPNLQSSIIRELEYIDNIQIVQPVPYQEMIELIYFAKFIVTDSGGIQEEAISLGKPLIVLRNESDRPEGLSLENVLLVGTHTEKITTSITNFVENKNHFEVSANNVYGDGRASQNILKIIRNAV
jgi:UDP-N-acetylglucosamine 2-epimerase (non-hydrolysing)